MAVLSEIEHSYGRLYASHASQPDSENNNACATLTRHFTKDLSEFRMAKSRLLLDSLKIENPMEKTALQQSSLRLEVNHP
jgi:hypothetical protein